MQTEDLSIFHSLPTSSALILPDAPRYTIAAVTQSYLDISGIQQDDVVGKGIFEAFPPNPADPDFTGAKNLATSFDEVVRTGKAHNIIQQRYDVHHKNNSFSERYWNSFNNPVFDQDGKLKYILHTVFEVTDKVKARRMAETMKGMQVVHNIFLQTPFAIAIIKGKDLIVELANDPIINIFKKGKDIIGKSVNELITDYKNKDFINLLHHVRESGEAYKAYERSVVILDEGKEHQAYFNFIFQPYYEEGLDAASGVIVFANDITERVVFKKELEKKNLNLTESEKAVRESEYRYRTLIDEASVATALYTGADIRIQYANNIMLGYWGKGPEIIGKPIREAIPELNDQGFPDKLEQVFRTGIEYNGTAEKAELMENGKLKQGYFTFTYKALRNNEGEIYGIHHMSIDVTNEVLAKLALEENERQLRNTILQAPVAICLFRGKDLTIEIANERMYESWGKRPEEVLGKNFFDAIPEVRDQGYEEMLQKVYETGETFSANELPVILPRNGQQQTLYMNFTYEPFREADGKISGIMAMANDVTDQVRARREIEELVNKRTAELAEVNDALLKSNQELARSNGSLEQFAYAASHDLKEPIRKIHYFAERLKGRLGEKLGEEELSLFQRMETAAKRMGSLIDDLLSYSEFNNNTGAIEEVDLNALVKMVLSDLDLEIEQTGAKVTVDKLFTMTGNHRQLQQAFQNLVANAIKYRKPDVPPEVKISHRVDKGRNSGISMNNGDMEKDFHVIEISDNGIGFEQRDAERIFNIFTRLHGNAEYKGTGVGLSIVRKVVENHNGYIVADSEPGVGSTFRIYFPIDPNVAENNGTKSMDTQARPGEDNQVSPSDAGSPTDMPDSIKSNSKNRENKEYSSSEVKIQVGESGQGRFYIYENGKTIAEMIISISGDVLTAHHTEVLPEAEGRGLAKKLFRQMAERAREHHLKVRPLCPYVHAQFKKHADEYGDLWYRNL